MRKSCEKQGPQNFVFCKGNDQPNEVVVKLGHHHQEVTLKSVENSQERYITKLGKNHTWIDKDDIRIIMAVRLEWEPLEDENDRDVVFLNDVKTEAKNREPSCEQINKYFGSTKQAYKMINIASYDASSMDVSLEMLAVDGMLLVRKQDNYTFPGVICIHFCCTSSQKLSLVLRKKHPWKSMIEPSSICFLGLVQGLVL